MTAEPIRPAGGPGGSVPFEMIHLCGQAAVVVPIADFLRLRVPERMASAEALADAEDTVALQEWEPREAAGENRYVSAGEARRRLGV